MENPVFYSIIVVCLNAGERLAMTLESIYAQNYGYYEIIIKDGGSTDGSLARFEEQAAKGDSRLRIYTQPDNGIYDAMNQAIAHATGEYLLFLNAGDTFYDETVLNKVTHGIRKKRADIVYGNLYHRLLGTVIYAAPRIDDFTCYRNVPCHQTCFYRRELFSERGYEPVYNVRADYEHFLWCYYEKKARIRYLPVIIASYEGGGYSETKENKRRSAMQHREITRRYMGRVKATKYRLFLLLTLAPLRTKLAESERFSTGYNQVKTFIYRLLQKGK